MDPVTAVAVAATVAGAGVSAYGALSQGQAQSNQFQYQAGIAALNKTVADQNANYATVAGEVSAEQSGMATRNVLGQEKVGQAAGNLDVNSGSPASVRSSTTEVGQQNQGIIRANTAKTAYGYEVEGVQDTEQQQLDLTAASNAQTAGKIGAISSILGGVSSVSSKWLQGGQSGLFGNSGVTGGGPLSFIGQQNEGSFNFSP